MASFCRRALKRLADVSKSAKGAEQSVRQVLTCGGIGLGLWLLTACGGLAGNPEIVATLPPVTQAPRDEGFPQPPPDLANGARIYAENCTRCHGVDGSGSGELVLAGEVGDPGSFLDPANVLDHTPREWFDIITNGRIERLMPPWRESLSEQARWDVAYYTYTLHEMAGQSIPPAATEEPAASATTAPAGEGTVTGQVTNGTALGTVPPDLTVTLFATDGRSETQRRETTLDADGRFRFEGVSLNPEQAYVAVVAYQERTFTSEFARGEGDTLDLPVTIYELTEDPSVITVVGMVSQVTAVADGLQVVQVINFRNNSDRVFTSSQQVGENQYASVVVALPPGGVILGFPEQEQRYIVPEDGATVIDSVPVLPGSDHLIQYIYFLPYQDGAIIEQPLNYALDGAVRLLLRPENVTATSDQLEPIGPQTLGEVTYSGYGAELSLQPGEAVVYELSGTGAATADEIIPPVVSSNNLVAVVLVVLIAQAVLIGGLYWFYRRRKTAAPEDKSRVIDALARQIAELDDAHERGDINHDLYHHRRQQLKARLAELMGEPEQEP